MHVDIVIVNFNTADLLSQALDSIQATQTDSVTTHTFVVDNDSTDDSVRRVFHDYPWSDCTVMEKNMGFGAANNRGIQKGTSPYILFLNSDAVLTQGSLQTLVDFMEEERDCAIVGPKLLNPDGSFQPSCRRFPTPLRNYWMYSGWARRFTNQLQTLQNWLTEEEHRHNAPVQMVSGACFLARRSYMESVQYFDENLFLYEEEADISIPAYRSGRSIAYCPDAEVIHHGGASVTNANMNQFATRHLFRSKYYCFRKHYGRVASRLTYWSDLWAFYRSTRIQKLRGAETDNDILLHSSKRGWKESFIPIDTLMKREDFYD
jgi:hypothetical protein